MMWILLIVIVLVTMLLAALLAPRAQVNESAPAGSERAKAQLEAINGWIRFLEFTSILAGTAAACSAYVEWTSSSVLDIYAVGLTVVAPVCFVCCFFLHRYGKRVSALSKSDRYISEADARKEKAIWRTLGIGVILMILCMMFVVAVFTTPPHMF